MFTKVYQTADGVVNRSVSLKISDANRTIYYSFKCSISEMEPFKGIYRSLRMILRSVNDTILVNMTARISNHLNWLGCDT